MHHLEETIIVFAVRYAIKRRTGASYAVRVYLDSVWDDLTEQTQGQILREIKIEKDLSQNAYANDLFEFWEERS